MQAFELRQVADERAQLGKLYLEFLRVPSMSAGLYVLAAGGVDPQRPHTEHEVYYVVRGRATIRVGDEDRAVGPGSVIYVPAGVPHRFHTIEDELVILVVFAPAQGTGAGVTAIEQTRTMSGNISHHGTVSHTIDPE